MSPRALLLLIPFVCLAARAETSALWGKAGEVWSPTGRLPDYSYSGYHCGEAPLPEYPVVANVKTFGAKGDGVTDDTRAIREAIASVKSGALLFPSGRYVITDFINLNKSGVVLRGEGPDKTKLYFPKPLGEIHPAPTHNSGGTPTQEWSWSGGFIRLNGKGKKAETASVLLRDAARGATTVAVANAKRFRPGQWVALREADPGDMSFVGYLYAGDPGATAKFPKQHGVRYPLRVVSVSGDTVTLDRALPLDFKTDWNAGLEPFNPPLTESGVEHLSFEFPVTPYQGHFKEAGFNPVTLGNAAHCWLRDIRFVNADSGPFVGADFCTLTGLVWETQRQESKSGHTGHHGMILGGTQNLVSDFTFKTKFIHDLTVSGGSYFNVFKRGSGVDLAFDHHERAPTGNLFTDIDLGVGKRPFVCGGGSALGKNCGAWATFWGLRSKTPVPFPAKKFGPELMNVVGVPAAGKAELNPAGKWYEPIAPESLEPRDIHAAQLARRLGKR